MQKNEVIVLCDGDPDLTPHVLEVIRETDSGAYMVVRRRDETTVALLGRGGTRREAITDCFDLKSAPASVRESLI